MFPSVMVRSAATLDFMMMQAENRSGCIGFWPQAYETPQDCQGRPHRQEGIGGWLSAGCSPEAGLSMHVKWVGE